MRVLVKLYFAVIGIFTIELFFLRTWLKYTFGKISMGQIVWHLTNTLDGVDFRICVSAGFSFICATALSILWVSFLYRAGWVKEKFCRFIQKPCFFKVYFVTSGGLCKWARYLSGFFLLVLFLLLCQLIDKDLKVVRFFESLNVEYVNSGGGADFFKEKVQIPAMKTISFESKRNIVVVMVESMERSYSLRDLHPSPVSMRSGNSLIPNLDELSEQHYSALNMYDGYGLNWTVAALTGWHFGLPLKVPPMFGDNSYYSYRGFLPNAQSIFDVLRYNGYTLVMLMGSDSNFAGMRMLFSQHGDFRILDKDYWEKAGYSLDENKGGWGYNDEFLLERAREEYMKLDAAGKPFVLLIQTIDTHGPNGYCPQEYAQYGDVRDAIMYVDRFLGSFSRWLLENKSKATAVIISGDHDLMAEPSFMENIKDRKIYNVFMGDIPEIHKGKLQQVMTAMDMAPSLLEAAGGKWGHNRYGLGVSIFSDEPTLAEQIGMTALDAEMEKPSAYYSTFY